MSGNRCVKGKEDYAVLLPFAGTLGMSEGGRWLPIINTASTMFSLYWERLFCPKADVQNCPLPGDVKLEASENLKS